METFQENDAFTVAEENVRLDKFLALRFPQYSRSYFQYLIKKELVLVNHEPPKKRLILKRGDEIAIAFAATPEICLEPQPLALDILYEDPYLLAINKPPGLVVHPGAKHFSGTFLNGLLYHCRQLQQSRSLRPGIVHRLDKDTSGVLLAAKTETAQQELVKLFSLRKMHKKYLAICLGNPGNRLIVGNIGRHPQKRLQMALLPEQGKAAETDCQTLGSDGKISAVALFPKTGRTHQIRVHLQSVHTPILGDPLYGREALNEKMQASRTLLHAAEIQFLHPILQKEMLIQAPLPQDIEPYFSRLCSPKKTFSLRNSNQNANLKTLEDR